MASPEFELRRTILTKLVKRAYKRTKPLIPSKTLRRSLRWEVTPRPRAFLEVPHYWAVYYHRGVTGPVTPRTKKFLVWYTNPKDDPRLVRGKGPERFAEVKRLSAADWKRGLDKNFLRRKRGQRPFMIIVKQKRGFRGTPFYDAALDSFGGAGGLLGEASEIAPKEFDKYMAGIFKKLKPLKMKKTVVINDKLKL